MQALANNYFTYAKEANRGRELILVEGRSAISMNLEPLAVTLMLKTRNKHFEVIEDNIKRYGKIKRFSKNN